MQGMSVTGLHHVTAMSGDAQKNVDFYAGVLGLKLVKVTVNYDDPATYHLYYGDATGAPGTLITFFPWPAHPGRSGVGQVGTTAYSVPTGSLEFWKGRLDAAGVSFWEGEDRYGEGVLSLADPDDMPIELVANDDPRPGFMTPEVGVEHAVRGLHSVGLWVAEAEPSVNFLQRGLGFDLVDEDEERVRLHVGAGQAGQIVDVIERPGASFGRTGAGAVHHVAFRVADDEAQTRFREELTALGSHTTEVQDRTYFHSIYFREPGGVLYEVATDVPGFSVDEPDLGSGLRLPKWLEPKRGEIVRGLAPIALPTGVTVP